MVVTCPPKHLGPPGIVEHEARTGWTAFGYELSGGATEREGDLLSFFGEDEESPLLLIDPVDDTGHGSPQEHDFDVLADMRGRLTGIRALRQRRSCPAVSSRSDGL